MKAGHRDSRHSPESCVPVLRTLQLVCSVDCAAIERSTAARISSSDGYLRRLDRLLISAECGSQTRANFDSRCSESARHKHARTAAARRPVNTRILLDEMAGAIPGGGDELDAVIKAELAADAAKKMAKKAGKQPVKQTGKTLAEIEVLV